MARAQEFSGSVDDYPKWLAAHHRGEVIDDTTAISSRDVDATPDPEDNSAQAKKERKRIEAERRMAMQPLTNRLKRCDREMEKLNIKKAEIETRLADNELYEDGQRELLKQLLTDQAYIQKELDQVEEEWFAVQEEIEQHQSMG